MDKIRNNDDEQSFSSHKSIGNHHPQYKTSKANSSVRGPKQTWVYVYDLRRKLTENI
jgi:hypothetical protein